MAKKVQSVTHQPLQQASNKINSEQLMNDLHYQQSRQIIQELRQPPRPKGRGL